MRKIMTGITMSSVAVLNLKVIVAALYANTGRFLVTIRNNQPTGIKNMAKLHILCSG
jgi:hypothetical protein